MGLESAKFSGAEQSEQKERTPKKAATAKRKEQSQEVTSMLGYYGINKALIYLATKNATEESKPASFKELYTKRPALVQIISGVAKYFKIQPAMLLATLHKESGFKHGAKGDLNYSSGKSIGIGQFQDSAWQDLNEKDHGPCKEFRAFMGKFYPGKKFKRGENLLTDIAASAAWIKYKASKRIRWESPGRHRLVQARARYKGDSNASYEWRTYYEEQKKKVPRDKSKVSNEYNEFMDKYIMYNTGLKEFKRLISAK